MQTLVIVLVPLTASLIAHTYVVARTSLKGYDRPT